MNILFYYTQTINPQKGGIHRVTDVLMRYFSEEHKVYCLMVKKEEGNEALSENSFYLPDSNHLANIVNKNYALELIEKYEIQVIINQAAISPYTSQFILDIRKVNNDIKLLSVVHNSLRGIYGVFGKVPAFLLKNRVVLHFLNICSYSFFKLKYGKYWNELVLCSDKVIALSKELEPSIKDFVSSQFISENKFISIHNPITIDVHTDLIKKKKQLLYVGRLSYEKNLEALLRIWSIVSLQKIDWELLIVGDGSQRTFLEEKAKKMNLHQISFEGRQSPEKYYAESSIFCMTSFFEGQPLVLLEAMAYGCVPVVFDSFETVKSIVNDTINGFIVKSNGLVEFAKALIELMNKQDLLEKMSAAAIKKANEFSLESIGKKWNVLFNFLENDFKIN